MGAVTPTRVIGGRYVVLAELGRGGMGIVWRAEDRMMGRHVAVKELHLPDGLGHEDRRLFRERLLREARTAGRLNDPSIVTVYDVVSDCGVDHIVMELIEAPTLADVVARSGPLGEASTSEVAQTAARCAAHRPRARGGAPRRQAVQRHARCRRAGHAHRLRHRPGRRRPAPDHHRLAGRLARLHGAGAAGRRQAPTRRRTCGASAPPSGTPCRAGARSPGTSTAATIAAVVNADVPTTRTRGPLGAVIAGLLQRDPRARLTGVQAAALLSGEPPTPPAGGAQEPPPTRSRLPGSSRRPPNGGGPCCSARWRVGLVVGLVAGLVLTRAPSGPLVYTYGAGGDIPVIYSSSQSCLQGQLAVGRQYTSSAVLRRPARRRGLRQSGPARHAARRAVSGPRGVDGRRRRPRAHSPSAP